MTNINKLINLAYKTPLYASLYEESCVSREELNNIDDLRKLPTVSKQELIDALFDAIGRPEDVVKYHKTSGTSGNPTVVAFTQNDWDMYVKQNVKCLQLIGATKKDIIYNTTPYGMFFAGLVLHNASIRLGARVIPAGTLSSAIAHFNLI